METQKSVFFYKSLQMKIYLIFGFLLLSMLWGCALTQSSDANQTVATEIADDKVDLGYTEVPTDEYTGSVQSEKVDRKKYGANITLIDILQRTPGVFVQGNGSGARAFVRGASSIRGSVEPLFVVDNVIIGDALSSVSFLNPNDIDKVTVIKDSESTALYGSRGVNGVILIRTKTE